MSNNEAVALKRYLNCVHRESAHLTVMLHRYRREGMDIDVIALLERRIDELDRKARRLDELLIEPLAAA